MLQDIVFVAQEIAILSQLLNYSCGGGGFPLRDEHASQFVKLKS